MQSLNELVKLTLRLFAALAILILPTNKAAVNNDVLNLIIEGLLDFLYY